MSEIVPFEFEFDDDIGPRVYVLAYAAGYVKVGYTAQPRERMRAHDLAARQVGGRIVDAWISPPHGNARANERALIGYCAGIAKRTTGKLQGEYFSGLHFDAVRAFAQSLPLEPVVHSDSESDGGVRCEACEVVDQRPLTAFALLHKIVIGELRVVDSASRDVSRDWAGPVIDEHCTPTATTTIPLRVVDGTHPAARPFFDMINSVVRDGNGGTR